MNVVIVGAGSVGMLLTYYFTKHRISPTLVTNRVEQASALHNKGLHLTYVDELSEDVSISAIPFSKLHTVKQIDLLIIAVKSYDVHKVLAGLNVNTVQAILFVQNGMSHTTLFDHIQIDEIGVASIEHGA